MTVTLNSREQTVRAFIRRKTRSTVLLYFAFFFIFLGVIVKRYTDISFTGLSQDTEFVLGLGIGIGLLIITYYLWRCPACGKLLGFKVEMKECPHCKAGFSPYWKADNGRRVVNAFSRKKKSRYLLYAVLFFIFFIAVMTAGQYQPVPLGGLYFILGVLVLIFGISDILIWRCPNCKSHLGRGWNPEVCHRCSTKFRQ